MTLIFQIPSDSGSNNSDQCRSCDCRKNINAKVFLFRKSKDDAKKILSQLQPLTPGCNASEDPAWTPGQWRAEQGYKDVMSDEKPVRQTVLQVYNDAISQIV